MNASRRGNVFQLHFPPHPNTFHTVSAASHFEEENKDIIHRPHTLLCVTVLYWKYQSLTLSIFIALSGWISRSIPWDGLEIRE